MENPGPILSWKRFLQGRMWPKVTDHPLTPIGSRSESRIQDRNLRSAKAFALDCHLCASHLHALCLCSGSLAALSLTGVYGRARVFPRAGLKEDCDGKDSECQVALPGCCHDKHITATADPTETWTVTPVLQNARVTIITIHRRSKMQTCLATQ
ncbi:hypothetical protein B0T19DRAFT_427127 [Cercophora scortea]|uniref:Uncharacterized protein n=1 Tax=Cercophora scortea TaxID=314031 RepID=A0AAE0IEX5_9PEZI|nr:hypothetical protein B0T19DRAFT_427127 [Cercophora scortea]